MKKILSYVTIASIAAASCSFLSLQPASANKHSPDVTANKSEQADLFYQNARAEMQGNLGALGEDYYAIYRIVERIARANGLDEHPWRIRVTSASNLNAYASELNVLTFEGGLLEQLEGDTAALACVVGHEMAHHTQNHIPIRVEVESDITALQEAALVQAREEVESAERRSNTWGVITDVVAGTIFGSGGNNSSGVEVVAGIAVHELLDGLNEDQASQATARAEELYEERVAALSSDFSEELHRQESESDEVGYGYMVRAGFSPSGCLRTMSVLNRVETSRLPSFSHPNPEDRLATLSSLNTTPANQSLVNQGLANLSQSANPLTYGIDRAQSSLRVNSRYGSQDIEDGFPQ